MPFLTLSILGSVGLVYTKFEKLARLTRSLRTFEWCKEVLLLGVRQALSCACHTPNNETSARVM